MPIHASEDLKKIQLRTSVLMRLLMRRTDTSNPNQFGKWLTERTKDWGWSDMQESKKWYPFVRGDIKRSPIGALRLLSQLFSDAEDLYWLGPSSIWAALWGTLNDQVDVMRSHPKCLPKEPLEIVIRKIEESVLIGNDGELKLPDLVRITALYRYLAVADPYGRTCDGNGFGHAYSAYGHVQTCYREPVVADELRVLGIYDALRAELAAIELRRVSKRPVWVAAIECGEIDESVRAEIDIGEQNRADLWLRTLSAVLRT